MSRIHGGLIALLAVGACGVEGASRLSAEEASPAISQALDLEGAVAYSLEHYPSVKASLERAGAAQAGVALARTSYLPRADVLWQGNRATRNSIFGLLLPNPVLSSISGPVLASPSSASVWGSAAGLLFTWEPIDFGRRSANVAAARAGKSLADSEVSLTRLDVALAVTRAFFTLAASEERLSAARANVERRRVFAERVEVLVANELRPGADKSRSDAELAIARTELFQDEQREEEARAGLEDLLGLPSGTVAIDATRVLGPPPEEDPFAPPLSAHPLATVEEARVEELHEQEKSLARSYFPRLYLQSTVFGRGSGADTSGTTEGGLAGLGLDRANWAAGLTVSFPALDIFSIRAQRQIAASNERAERARYDQTLDDLSGLMKQAAAAVKGARRVAENTPVELKAARDTESQAEARYKAGLANAVEVAEAQSLLVQGEIDDALARLAVWSNLASLAAAQGDLEPFLTLLRGKPRGDR